MKSTTALIILNYNNSSDTRNCIESILHHNTAAVRYIVVDNASRPEEREALRRVMHDTFGGEYTYLGPDDRAEDGHRLARATLVETGENLGYGRGNNAGLAYAYADPDITHVMILNNDVLFVEDIIPGLISQHSQTPGCGIISPLLYKKGMNEYDINCARVNERVGEIIRNHFFSYLYKAVGKSVWESQKHRFLLLDKKSDSGLLPIELPSGSCMLMPKDMFQSLGSFDPNTFLYYEENILYKKTDRRGLTNYVSLDYPCVHLGAASISTLDNNPWLVKQALKSRRYYVMNYSGANAATKLLYLVSEYFFKASVGVVRFTKRFRRR